MKNIRTMSSTYLFLLVIFLYSSTAMADETKLNGEVKIENPNETPKAPNEKLRLPARMMNKCLKGKATIYTEKKCPEGYRLMTDGWQDKSHVSIVEVRLPKEPKVKPQRVIPYDSVVYQARELERLQDKIDQLENERKEKNTVYRVDQNDGWRYGTYYPPRRYDRPYGLLPDHYRHNNGRLEYRWQKSNKKNGRVRSKGRVNIRF